MARIVVVGSVAQDELVRLSAPLRLGSHGEGRACAARMGGGGANSAVALAHAGHHVTLVGAVGSDAAGVSLRGALLLNGVDISAVAVVAGSSTRSLLLVDPAGERTIVNLGRAQEPDPPERLRHLAADLVYVRSRDTRLAPILSEMMSRCPVVAHVPPLQAGVFPAHGLVASASDLDGDFLADPWTGATLAAGPGLRWLALTQGGQGAELRGADGVRCQVAASAVAAVDSTGAGDAFSAGLLHALAAGATPEEALETGVRWGTAKVACAGSALDRRTVAALLQKI